MALYQGSSQTLEGNISFSASQQGQIWKDGTSHTWQRGGRKSQPTDLVAYTCQNDGHFWGNLCNLMSRTLSPPPTPKHVSLRTLRWFGDWGGDLQGDHMWTLAHIWEDLQLCRDKQHKLRLSKATQNTWSPSTNPKEDGFVSCHPAEGRFKMETSWDLENKVFELQVDLLFQPFTFQAFCSWSPRRSIY